MDVSVDIKIDSKIYQFSARFPVDSLKAAQQNMTPAERLLIESLSAPGSAASDQLVALSILARGIEALTVEPPTT
jgi:hypothetical protein